MNIKVNFIKANTTKDYTFDLEDTKISMAVKGLKHYCGSETITIDIDESVIPVKVTDGINKIMSEVLYHLQNLGLVGYSGGVLQLAYKVGVTFTPTLRVREGEGRTIGIGNSSNLDVCLDRNSNSVKCHSSEEGIEYLNLLISGISLLAKLRDYTFDFVSTELSCGHKIETLIIGTNQVRDFFKGAKKDAIILISNGLWMVVSSAQILEFSDRIALSILADTDIRNAEDENLFYGNLCKVISGKSDIQNCNTIDELLKM